MSCKSPRTLLDSHGFVFRWLHHLEHLRCRAADQESIRASADQDGARFCSTKSASNLTLTLPLNSEKQNSMLACRCPMFMPRKRLPWPSRWNDLKRQGVRSQEWEQDNSFEELKAEAARASSIKDAQHKNEMAKLEVERQRIMAAPVMEMKEKKPSKP